ncbi:hypothetical protein UlMin_001386 [Ulmus minor]
MSSSLRLGSPATLALNGRHHHHHQYSIPKWPPLRSGSSFNLHQTKLVGLGTPNPATLRRKGVVLCNYQVADLAPAASSAYGLLLLTGGLFAYTKSGSKGSLFGGLSGAALMAIAYFLMQTPETKQLGDAFGFGAAFLFSCVFGIRLAATQKQTPTGPLLGLSLGVLVVFVQAYLRDGL